MNWESESLGDLCSLITDGKHGDCVDEENSGFYFISAKDIRDGQICYDGARQISESDFAETHRRTDLRPGDIVLTNSGTIGRLAVASDEDVTRRTTFQKSVAVLKPTKKVASRFLYYFLIGNTTALENAARGAAQKNLLLSELRRFSVVTPPIEIQRRVADLLSSYDELIENNGRRMALLEDAARLLYQEWFGHLRFPGHEHTAISSGVPEGWEPKTLGDICSEIRDTVSPNDVESDTPYIGLEHMPRRSISLRDWGKAEAVTSSKHGFKVGDILFGKIRPYFHKVGIAFTDGLASSDAIVIRPNGDQLRSFVLMTVSSDKFVAEASQTMREGSKMPRADWKLMTKYPIAMPPSGLLETFSDSVTAITDQLRALTFQSQKLSAARDLLLPRLMSGEIAV